jgi:AMOP domain
MRAVHCGGAIIVCIVAMAFAMKFIDMSTIRRETLGVGLDAMHTGMRLWYHGEHDERCKAWYDAEQKDASWIQTLEWLKQEYACPVYESDIRSNTTHWKLDIGCSSRDVCDRCHLHAGSDVCFRSSSSGETRSQCCYIDGNLRLFDSANTAETRHSGSVDRASVLLSHFWQDAATFYWCCEFGTDQCDLYFNMRPSI